jgi:orotate phosphoribosyltransferase
LVSRSEQELDLAIPFFSCHRAITPAYPPQDCPLCRARIPLTKPGGG